MRSPCSTRIPTPTRRRSSPRAARPRASSRAMRPPRWSGSTSASPRRWPTSPSAARATASSATSRSTAATPSSSTPTRRSRSRAGCEAVVRRVLAACVLTLTADLAPAQVLSIGETLARGKYGLLLTDNASVPGEGIPNLNIFYGEFARGLGDRFDLYLSFGETTTDGETQVWTGGGGHRRRARAGKVTFSLFTVASVALTRRDEACQVLWNPALIASTPVGKQLTLYSRRNRLIPIR